MKTSSMAASCFMCRRPYRACLASQARTGDGRCRAACPCAGAASTKNAQRDVGQSHKLIAIHGLATGRSKLHFLGLDGDQHGWRISAASEAESGSPPDTSCVSKSMRSWKRRLNAERPSTPGKASHS